MNDGTGEGQGPPAVSPDDDPEANSSRHASSLTLDAGAPTESSLAASHWAWGGLAVVVALLAVPGVFSSTRIFILRDMTIYFWPAHLWLRRTVLAGQIPLWDPYPGFGQSAVADPVRQLFFLPTLLPRLLLPEVIGFNVSVALAFPVAALGAYLFFTRHASRPAASLGALVFALSGPMLSTGHMINNSWSAAFIPWVLLCVDRFAGRPARGCPPARYVAVLALVVATQLLAGEPVVFTATLTLAVSFAAVGAPIVEGGWRPRATLVLWTVAGCAAGALLAAVQIFPLLDAVPRSLRSLGFQQPFAWSLHPLRLVEVVTPNLLGDPLAADPMKNPWLGALNGGREPYLYSIYIGACALALALLGAIAPLRRRWAIFWTVVLAVALVLALGGHTFVYPAVWTAIPPLRSFRFPTKYTAFAVMAVAALVAVGWDTLWAMANGRADGRKRLLPVAFLAALVGVAGVSTLFAIVLPRAASDVFARVSAAAGIAHVAVGAEALAHSLPSAALRLLLIAAGGAVCLWFGGGRRPEARRACQAFFAVIVFDLLVMSGGLNPTGQTTLFDEPDWVAQTRAYPSERVYIGGHARDGESGDVDGPKGSGPPEMPYLEGLYSWVARSSTLPSAWSVREAISIDSTTLWPAEYTRASWRFGRSTREERTRFLARTGVRYHLTSTPPESPLRELVPASPLDAMALYEVPAPIPRASLVEAARVVPDITRQTELLFAAEFEPSREVLLLAPPPMEAGRAGTPAAEPGAQIVEDDPGQLGVRAHVGGGGGYLLLLETYDPNWSVEVDGAPAPLLRANGLFRAVRLAEGEHTVKFRYRPWPFYAGLLVSTATALCLTALCLRRVRASSSAGAVEGREGVGQHGSREVPT